MRGTVCSHRSPSAAPHSSPPANSACGPSPAPSAATGPGRAPIRVADDEMVAGVDARRSPTESLATVWRKRSCWRALVGTAPAARSGRYSATRRFIPGEPPNLYGLQSRPTLKRANVPENASEPNDSDEPFPNRPRSRFPPSNSALTCRSAGGAAAEARPPAGSEPLLPQWVTRPIRPRPPTHTLIACLRWRRLAYRESTQS
jgi:hypothetical protein